MRPQLPGVLDAIADCTARLLRRNGIARQRALDIGQEVAAEVAARWGGRLLYVPRGAALEMALRNGRIRESFDGANYGALAVRFNLSEARVRRIVTRRACRPR